MAEAANGLRRRGSVYGVYGVEEEDLKWVS